jgi:hypothetical protein
VFIGAFGDFPAPDGGRSSLRETLVAKITSIATILASPDIGQTRVAEVGLESGFYRYITHGKDLCWIVTPGLDLL